MKIKVTSVFVENQDEALKFYTGVLGFVKEKDIPLGGDFRWLTVTSTDGGSNLELILEPNANPTSKTYQESIKKQGIPATMFFIKDHDSMVEEVQRMKNLGVTFTMDVTKTDAGSQAIFDDTCGNLIMIHTE